MKKYLVILCATILIIIGLVFYWGQSAINSNAHPNWHAVLGNAGSVVLISGLLTLLHDLIIKKFENDRLCTLLQLSESITKSGLRTILTNCADYNYTELIEKSTNFSAIMNDGLRWVGNYTPALEKRFNRKHTETELFLVNPKCDFLKPLAEKTSTTTIELEKKLGQTISLIESTYEKSTKAGHLKIYFLKHYPTLIGIPTSPFSHFPISTFPHFPTSPLPHFPISPLHHFLFGFGYGYGLVLVMVMVICVASCG